MKNYIKVLIIVIVITIGVYVYYQKLASPVVTTTPDSVMGCYVATLAKDVYRLNITSQTNERIEGMLQFKNFEKDSSRGTLKGTYKDGVILGDYSFQSEGMDSVMQVAFKKIGTDFVRGYGETTGDGTRFADTNDIEYDTSAVFKASKDGCLDMDTKTPVSTTPAGKLPAGSTPPGDATLVQAHTWVWQKTVMSDDTVVVPKKANAFTITFGANEVVSGSTDCNGFSGTYRIGSDGVITFGPLASTKMFCEGSQEGVFTKTIAQSTSYMIDASGNLVLLLAYDSGSVLFKKQ